jgi:phosphoglycerate kinase
MQRASACGAGDHEIADKGGKVILLSHFGAPRTRPETKPVAAEVSRIIKRPVKFADDCIGETAEQAVAAMKPGDILCLENTRFHAGEEKNDPAFVAALAKLGDIWVNDAFSAAHRAHASTEGLGHKLPAYAGRTCRPSGWQGAESTTPPDRDCRRRQGSTSSDCSAISSTK